MNQFSEPIITTHIPKYFTPWIPKIREFANL